MDKSYWTERYINGNTGWDIGSISTPIKEYIDQIEDKSIRVLIPGAGNSYEGQYLWENGFRNTFLIDLSAEPLKNFKSRVPNFPETQLIQGDFFSLEQEFNLIIEQTFFCALDPKLRPDYVEKMRELLADDGRLVGLLFDFPLTDQGPPFGGSTEEYLTYFDSNFEIQTLERAYNSILPRSGKELFINLMKKV